LGPIQPVVIATLVGYLGLIFGIQAFMRDKQPLKLQFLFQLHNVILSSGSLLLLILMLEEILPIGLRLGPYGMICGEKAWTKVITRLAAVHHTNAGTAENGILLHDQLFLQMP
jgi:hypothetical protein